MNEQRIVGQSLVDRDKAVCIECHEPFKYLPLVAKTNEALAAIKEKP